MARKAIFIIMAALIILMLAYPYLHRHTNIQALMRYIINGDVAVYEKTLVKQILAQNFYGEPTDAGRWYWVNIVNINPVSCIDCDYTSNRCELQFGDPCACGTRPIGGKDYGVSGIIQFRGSVNGNRLYEYTASDDPGGTMCPSGILYFLEKYPGSNYKKYHK
ncbi:hypothetical protein C4569_02865 [Candidatus Parcubacteria bacterium]|nr:MAG: hypothetical protein C4569_02865 [Candidatus Parcubacteria bacterium]